MSTGCFKNRVQISKFNDTVQQILRVVIEALHFCFCLKILPEKHFFEFFLFVPNSR